jgi:hypothetical protein
MKNSTILVVGTLGLIGAYLYLKRKQSPMINEIVDNSLELSTSSTSSATTTTSPTTDSSATTTTTSPTTDTNATTTTTSPTTDTNATTTTPSVADISLGLNPKPIIETETENYIKAKELSKGFQVLFQQMQDLQNKLRYTYPSYGFGTFKKPSTDNREAIIIQMSSVTKQMSEKNAQAIALGYKILPLGEIEKL